MKQLLRFTLVIILALGYSGSLSFANTTVASQADSVQTQHMLSYQEAIQLCDSALFLFDRNSPRDRDNGWDLFLGGLEQANSDSLKLLILSKMMHIFVTITYPTPRRNVAANFIRQYFELAFLVKEEKYNLLPALDREDLEGMAYGWYYPVHEAIKAGKLDSLEKRWEDQYFKHKEENR